MAKGNKQPKIKISQPIALAPELRDILEKHGVRKPPTVDKVEALEKAATAKKWLFLIKQNRSDGMTHATLEVPGPDGLIYFEATEQTTALAMTHALCDALENGPQQSTFIPESEPLKPDGSDLPMFRGNGGTAGPLASIFEDAAGVNVADVEVELTQHLDQLDPFVPPADIEEDDREFDPEMMDLEDQFDDMLAAAGDVDPALRDDLEEDAPEWRFLFIVDPADIALWKVTPPSHDDLPVVDWEEGGPESASDRGWYIDPVYDYNHTLGEIKLLSDEDGDLLVWSREETVAAAKPKGKKKSEPKGGDGGAVVTAPVAGAVPESIVSTLQASGIPVKYEDGLYRNPLGDAYPSGWAEQEAGIVSRSIGFQTDVSR